MDKVLKINMSIMQDFINKQSQSRCFCQFSDPYGDTGLLPIHTEIHDEIYYLRHQNVFIVSDIKEN